MTGAAPPLLIHASCVALDGHGVLLSGPSGAGKSDLALRLIDRGAMLVADDYCLLSAGADGPVAQVAETIAGRIEVRGIGIVTLPCLAAATVRLLVRLAPDYPRMPEREVAALGPGMLVPAITLDPFEASAPHKVALALARIIGEQP